MNFNYDRDYYENGLQSGISAYENYRWIPELTIPLAYELILNLDIKRHDTILDFGCAKGYLVKAFRLLHYRAFGVDASHYAINNAPQDISNFVKWQDPKKQVTAAGFSCDHFDWIIAKDVFEHIKYEMIEELLIRLKLIGQNMFVIVPLGNNHIYNAPTNNLDKSHIICEDYFWWTNIFHKTDWTVSSGSSDIAFIKENYKGINNAHGYFKLSQNHE